ncbi:MAG: hypothetical protein V7744_11625 [Pseudomonadales bacterium]
MVFQRHNVRQVAANHHAQPMAVATVGHASRLYRSQANAKPMQGKYMPLPRVVR